MLNNKMFNDKKMYYDFIRYTRYFRGRKQKKNHKTRIGRVGWELKPVSKVRLIYSCYNH